MSEISNTKNVKRLSTPINYMFGSEDDVLDIDTTGGVANIYLPNILESGSLLVRKRIYINDVGNNASVNNINIITLGGNKINSLTTIALDVNGISTEIVITNRTEYIANLSTDNGGGGGTVTGADNGLTLVGTTIKLGGTLLAPTTIDALGSNTFSVNDQQGLFMQTRDILGNFFFNNIGGTGTLIGSSQYIFSYLGDGGNVFEDSLIVINFGGANNIKGSTDFWNFGDYQISDNSSSIFNFGRKNNYYNSDGLFVNGFNNIFSSFATANIFGSYNTISNGGDLIVIGAYNTIIGESQKIIIGNNNQNLVVDGTNGYVGIGTFTPSALLDIVAVDNVPYALSVRNNTHTTNPLYGQKISQENNGRVMYYIDGQHYMHVSVGGSVCYTTDGYVSPDTQLITQAFAVGSASYALYAKGISNNGLTVDGDGNVGINQFTATAKLHIKGIDSTSSNYALKVDNSAFVSLLSVRNDGLIGLGINSFFTNANTLARTYTLPDVSTILVGRSVLGVSGQIPYYTNANELTNDSGFTIGANQLLFSRATATVTQLNITNTTNSTSSTSGIFMAVSGSANNSIKTFSATYTTSGLLQANLINYNSNTSVGVLHSINGGFHKWAIGGIAVTNEIMRLTTGGLYVSTLGTLSNATATIHAKGIDATSGNFSLKVDNSASSPLLYVRNDAFVSINQNTIGVARLEITGGAGAEQGIYTQTTASISINGNDTTGIGVKGQATTGVGLQGNIGGAVGSALKLDDNVNGILLMKVGSNGTKSIINVINLPTSNAGLSSGDMYVDTAVNILANGDKVVGWKV